MSVMNHKLVERLIRFGAGDQALSIFLVLLAVVVFVMPAFADPAESERPVAEIFFALMLIAGAVASSEQRWMRLLIPPTVVLVLVVRWALLVSGAHGVVWRELTSLVALALFITVVAGRIYRRGPITGSRIHGAMAVYILLGLAWASFYTILYDLNPAAFSGVGDAPTTNVWTYYSLVTLTTMGYGDIVPVHPIARSAAALEGLTGQLYLAITIARLVASQRSRDES